MKNTKFYFTIMLISASIVIINGCKKGDTGPAGANGAAGPAGPNLKGTLEGHITLADQYGTSVFTGLNNISVSIDNTGLTATTDNAGMYSFGNLNTNDYSLTINKDTTYGMTKAQGIQFVGGGILNRDAKLSQIPTFSLGSAVAVDTATAAGNYIKIRGSVTADTKARKAVVFVGASASVSSNTTNYISFYSVNIAANATTFSLSISTNDFYGMGMSSGATAYFAVYPASSLFASTSTYEDFNTGKTVFTSIGKTAMAVSAPVQ